MRNKTIWIVNEYNYPDAINSRQTNLCRLLNEHGYQAYIISGSSGNKGEDNRIQDGAKVKYVETSEARGFIIKTADYNNSFQRVLVAIQFQRRLWRLRDQLPMPDVIISDFAGLFGYVFLRWKRKYGTKLIYDILDLWPEGFIAMGYIKRDSLIASFLYHLEHKSYCGADSIVFSMQGGRDYIVDRGWGCEVGGDINTENIGYLNNGVNLNVVDRQKDLFVLDDLDLSSSKFKVVYLGSISDFNGVDILVEAARILQETDHRDIMILIYGYGNREEALKRKVMEYGLENVVFKGKLDKRYAMNLLSRSDLNVFTFKNTHLLKYGVSPNKLFMYFASGRPVLSLIRPAYDLVEECKAGLSVENEASLAAEAIIRFSRMNNGEYLTYCQNARKIAVDYDYRKLVQVLINHIEG